ncbi:hypothetical protein [Streptomyces sp. IMTB 1903]|uniref:hypothetical protein n=1 Tax=Streptomyces sp. IMTB 1903 TaxID=1776680 RepID=UPI00075CB2A3|nr:hypothetical protein [Streptomyces sp. IMTB 1903]
MGPGDGTRPVEAVDADAHEPRADRPWRPGRRTPTPLVPAASTGALRELLEALPGGPGRAAPAGRPGCGRHAVAGRGARA